MKKPNERDNQAVHMILRKLSNTKSKEVTMFKSMYQEFFSQIQVPVLLDCNELVVIDKDKAIAFLKREYHFYDKKELAEALQELADELQQSETPSQE